MNYSVDWTPEADARLAEVWLNHPAARQAITERKTGSIRLLAADPLRHAQSQVEGLYTLDDRRCGHRPRFPKTSGVDGRFRPLESPDNIARIAVRGSLP